MGQVTCLPSGSSIHAFTRPWCGPGRAKISLGMARNYMSHKLFLQKGFHYQLRSCFCFRLPFIWEVTFSLFPLQCSIVLRYSLMFPLTVLLILVVMTFKHIPNVSVILCWIPFINLGYLKGGEDHLISLFCSLGWMDVFVFMLSWFSRKCRYLLSSYDSWKRYCLLASGYDEWGPLCHF